MPVARQRTAPMNCLRDVRQGVPTAGRRWRMPRRPPTCRDTIQRHFPVVVYCKCLVALMGTCRGRLRVVGARACARQAARNLTVSVCVSVSVSVWVVSVSVSIEAGGTKLVPASITQGDHLRAWSLLQVRARRAAGQRARVRPRRDDGGDRSPGRA